MILILTLTYDRDVDLVIDWLLKIDPQVDFLRINFDDLVEFNFSLDISKKELTVNGKIVKSIYLRKYGFSFINKYFISDDKYFSYFQDEISNLLSYIDCLKDKINILGTFSSFATNKLIQLHFAKEVGLLIPDTLITNFKQQYLNRKLITKGIRNSPPFTFDGFESLMFTKDVLFDKLPNTFFPSLFQLKIEKEIEVRVFFIKNKFYSLAFFDKKTDLRVGDFDNFTECSLPNEILIKLEKLITFLKVNTGSIDLLVTKDYQFFFLEINTSGIFDMVAKPLNVQLHKMVALELLKKYE